MSTKRSRPAKARQASRGRSAARTLGRRSLFLAKLVLPLLLLVVGAGSVLYVRLLNGPISLQFLAEPIGRSIAAEMPGIKVAIEDALVRLTDKGRVEFRMRNVRFSDGDGATIGLAPLAAVGMSPAALWSGRIAPDKIVLIEPRLLLVYNEQTGFSVSFPKQADIAAKAAAPQAPPGQDDGLSALQRVDIPRLLAEAGQRARKGADAASFLRSVGVRNATLVIDRAGRQSVMTILEGDVELEHRKKRSTVSGTLQLAAASGPWEISFKAEEAEKSNSVAIDTTIRDLVPRGLAPSFPDVPLLAALDAPLSGQGRLELQPDGHVVAGELKLEMAKGALVSPGTESKTIPIEKGRLELAFDPQSREVRVAPSELVWQGGQVTFGGLLKAADGGQGGNAWQFDLRADGGSLTGAEFGVPSVAIEEAIAQGAIDPEAGRVSFGLLRLKVGGAQMDAAGDLTSRGGQQQFRLDGRFGPAQIGVVKAVWPRLLGPGGRRWVGRQVSKGRTNGGTFKVDLSIVDGVMQAEGRNVSLSMEAADLAFAPGRGIGVVEVPRALLRIEGDSLEISMPDAVTQLAANRRVALKNGRFTAVALYDEPTLGEIAFRYQAPLAAAVEYLEQDGLGIGSLGLPLDSLDGKAEGHIKINLPLVSGVQLSDMKIEGKARVTDGRLKQAIGAHDIQGATINIDIGEGAVNATGQMLVGGVHSRLSFQRFLEAPADRQPPLRLTGTLDASDRAQLGLDINHIVSGDVPVDLSMTRGANNEQQIKVRADLSSAELSIEPLAWRKAPGRQAAVEFDLVRVSKARNELQNFRVVGDDIAIDGILAMDGKGRLTDFQLPNFALTLVSRMEVQGAMRPDNVWDLRVKGGYWDGREFFKQLFAIGGAPERGPPARKDQPGVDLKADIDTVLGHGDISLKGLRLQLSRRNQKLVGLIARGNVEGGKPIEVGMQETSNEPRKLVARTDDAGQAFRMVGFYPNMQGGEMRLDINLDGKGTAEKTGRLDVHNFKILGDAVVSEVLQTPDQARRNEEAGVRPRRKMERQSIDFWLMQAPFLVGYNQMVLENAQLRGPLLGASLLGKADFKLQQVDIIGTYAPLQGVNAVFSGVPLMGPLLNGPRGEGVVGINFHIAGPMAQPQVMVNPLSIVLPGPLRGLAEMTPTNYRIVPRDEKPPAPPPRLKPQAPVGGEPVRQAPVKAAPRVAPEVTGGWSTKQK